MTEDYDIVKSDFNEIAGLGSDPKWNHNNCYFPYLLQHIPAGTGTCLDIGCGKGELSALLSKRASKVVAVDLADKNVIMSFEGRPIPPEDIELMRRLLRGSKKDDE